MRIKPAHENKLVCVKKFTLTSTMRFQGGLEAKDVLTFRKGLTRGTGTPWGL